MTLIKLSPIESLAALICNWLYLRGFAKVPGWIDNWIIKRLYPGHYSVLCYGLDPKYLMIIRAE